MNLIVYMYCDYGLGGVVVIMMRQEYLQDVAEYRNKLEPLMREYVSSDRWECIERTVLPAYSFGKNGVIFIHRVKCNGF